MEIGGGGLLCSTATTADAMTERAMSQLERNGGSFLPAMGVAGRSAFFTRERPFNGSDRDAKPGNLSRLRRVSTGTGGNWRQASADVFEPLQSQV
jgi:hypothetical protein